LGHLCVCCGEMPLLVTSQQQNGLTTSGNPLHQPNSMIFLDTGHKCPWAGWPKSLSKSRHFQQ
jgi:hypothetical protein